MKSCHSLDELRILLVPSQNRSIVVACKKCKISITDKLIDSAGSVYCKKCWVIQTLPSYLRYHL